jgi:hypothetical protein
MSLFEFAERYNLTEGYRADDVGVIVGPFGRITGEGEESSEFILWVDGAGDDYFFDPNNPTDAMAALKLIGFR